ncbi:MAG: OsmC family protein [Bacteroidota bacterium]
MKEHQYTIRTEWTGNKGSGTFHYASYDRNHIISAAQKATDIAGSSDPSFRGDRTRYNPEELFLSSLSACHMLWYLHLCTVNSIIVTDYVDNATGIMEETENGGGRFTEVVLYPVVTVSDESMIEKANALHHEANAMCFIANSCNFPIKHKPTAKK